MRNETVSYKISIATLLVGVVLIIIGLVIDPYILTFLGVVFVAMSIWGIHGRHQLIKQNKKQNVIFVTKNRFARVDLGSLKGVTGNDQQYVVSCFIEGGSLLNDKVTQADLDILFPYTQKVLEKKLGMKLKFHAYSYASVYFDVLK